LQFKVDIKQEQDKHAKAKKEWAFSRGAHRRYYELDGVLLGAFYYRRGHKIVLSYPKP